MKQKPRLPWGARTYVVKAAEARPQVVVPRFDARPPIVPAEEDRRKADAIRRFIRLRP